MHKMSVPSRGFSNLSSMSARLPDVELSNRGDDFNRGSVTTPELNRSFIPHPFPRSVPEYNNNAPPGFRGGPNQRNRYSNHDLNRTPMISPPLPPSQLSINPPLPSNFSGYHNDVQPMRDSHSRFAANGSSEYSLGIADSTMKPTPSTLRHTSYLKWSPSLSLSEMMTLRRSIRDFRLFPYVNDFLERNTGVEIIDIVYTNEEDIVFKWLVDTGIFDEESRSYAGYIGLDCEWKPIFRKGEKENVSVLQIGIADKSIVVQLNKLISSSDPAVCGCLFNMLNSPDITVLGVGIDEDLRKLVSPHSLRGFPFKVPVHGMKLQCNAVDILPLVEKDKELQPRPRGGLKGISGVIFGVPSWKVKSIVMSDWSMHPLNELSVVYAALDAVFSYRLAYHYLKKIERNCR